MSDAQCDIQKTAIIEKLLTVPYESRDKAWNESFLTCFADACLTGTAPEVIQGPDGMPYFGFMLPEPGQPFLTITLMEMLPVLLRSGMGVVFNPTEGGRPDWVLNYGDLVAFNETRDLNAQVAAMGPGGSAEPGQVMVAAPSERLLPGVARQALRTFLTERCNIDDPRVLLVTEASGFQALAFNVFDDEFSPQDFDWLMRMIQWHLPRHVNLVAAAREAFDESNYLPL